MAFFGVVEEFFEEVGRVDAAVEQERGEGVYGDGIGSDGVGFDADACEEGLGALEPGQPGGRGVDDGGGEHPLAFEVGLEDAFKELFEHHAFVECVLVDDEQALLVLGD